MDRIEHEVRTQLRQATGHDLEQIVAIQNAARRDVPLLTGMQCVDIWTRLSRVLTAARGVRNAFSGPLREDYQRMMAITKDYIDGTVAPMVLVAQRAASTGHPLYDAEQSREHKYTVTAALADLIHAPEISGLELKVPKTKRHKVEALVDRGLLQRTLSDPKP